MENLKFTRIELYDLLWSMSVRSLAAKYTISESEIKIACKNHNIPTPLAGHWSKLDFNKPVTIIPLPDKENENQVIVFKPKMNEGGEIIKELSSLELLQKDIEDKLGNKLEVPERLNNPDKAIIATKEIVSGKFKYSNKEYYDILKKSMDIKVSKEQALRALRIIDTLIKALRVRGHKVNISYSSTIVTINGQNLEIGLREKTKRVKRESDSRYDSYDYVHVGILVIKVIESYSDKEFADGKLPLEKQLSLIIASFELWANEKNERAERWRLDQIKRDEERRIRIEFEKRQDNDLRVFKQTLYKAERWHKSENLRNYISEVEARAIVNNNLTEDIKAWLIWARKKADWYDPFIETNDELLNEVDKETLTINQKQSFRSY